MSVTFLQNPKVFASPVVLYLVSELGSDVIEYEPETIGEFLRSREPKISQQVIDRANAALGLYTSNLFWYNPSIFNIVCRALSLKRFPQRAPATLLDMAWGMTEVKLLMNDPEDSETSIEKFSLPVIRYIKFALKSEGIYTTPDAMKEIGNLTFDNPISDPSIDLAVQQRSDQEAAQIDKQVDLMVVELLRQIRQSGVPIIKQASNDLNEMLQDFGSNIQ